MLKMIVSPLVLLLLLLTLPALAAPVVLDSELEARRSGSVRVQLEDGISRFEVTATRRGGVTQLHGRDMRGRMLVLTDAGRGWSGTLNAGGKAYDIGADGVARVRPRVAAGHDAHRHAANTSLAKADDEGEFQIDPNETELGILFAYSQRALDEFGLQAIQDRAYEAETYLNAVLANSGLAYTAKVVGVQLSSAPDPEDQDLLTYANGFQANKGDANELRERFGGDLGYWLRGSVETTANTSGVANGYGGGDDPHAERAVAWAMSFATVRPTTVAHEVGHLLGGGHEAPERGWKTYSSAYECGYYERTPQSSGYSGTAVATYYSYPVYSTPDFVREDGTVCGNAEAGDNTRTFTESLPTIVSYYPRAALYSTLTLTQTAVDVAEDVGTVTIEVLRSGDLSRTASVTVAANGYGERPAQDGVTFGAVFTQLDFGAGEDRKTVQVDVIDNDTWGQDVYYGEKQFSVSLRFAVDADIDVDETIFTIKDNEEEPQAGGGGGGDSGGGGAFGWSLLGLLAGAAALRCRRRMAGVGSDW